LEKHLLTISSLGAQKGKKKGNNKDESGHNWSEHQWIMQLIAKTVNLRNQMIPWTIYGF
jgi:hypothetical protein